MLCRFSPSLMFACFLIIWLRVPLCLPCTCTCIAMTLMDYVAYAFTVCVRTLTLA